MNKMEPFRSYFVIVLLSWQVMVGELVYVQEF